MRLGSRAVSIAPGKIEVRPGWPTAKPRSAVRVTM